MTFVEGIALCAALVSAAAALGSWCAAVASRKTADRLAGIELERQHRELAPVFTLELNRDPGDSKLAHLLVTLVPGGVETLDEVVLRILDSPGQNRRACGPPGGVSATDFERFVWSPWVLDEGASAQVLDPRTTKPRPYSREGGQEWNRLQLRQSRPGHWMTGMSEESWSAVVGSAMRVQLNCKLAGHRDWTRLLEVPPAPDH